MIFVGMILLPLDHSMTCRLSSVRSLVSWYRNSGTVLLCELDVAFDLRINGFGCWVVLVRGFGVVIEVVVLWVVSVDG